MPGIAWIIAAVLTLVGHVHADDGAVRETAEVYSARSGRLLYREMHSVGAGAGPERWVLYTRLNGEPFARKRVLASGTPPDFEPEDHRDGRAQEVGGEGMMRRVHVRTAAPESGRRIEVPTNRVIDAGFDAIVRLQFLIPGRQRFYPMRLERIGSLQSQGIDGERLHMRLDSWLASAVPDVGLIHARRDRRLLAFNGTGNVRAADGRNPHARIAFAEKPVRVDAAGMTDLGERPPRGTRRI